MESESGRMENYVCTYTILRSSSPYLLEYERQGSGLTAAVELFIIDFKRVGQETSHTEIPKLLQPFSCYSNGSRSLTKNFIIFASRFQQTCKKIFHTTKGNMLAVTIVLSLFITVAMCVMKLERQHMCSPPEQMKTL